MNRAQQNDSEPDPKMLWQNQPREEASMTLKLIRQRAEDLRIRTRRELFGNLTTVPITVAVSWFGFLHTHHLRFRLAFVAAVVWAILGQYLLHRGVWSATPPERSALMTGLEFYRREIDRRRNLLGRLLQWSFGPIILCLGTLILLLTGMALNMGKFGAALPFSTVVAIWVVGMFALRSRNQRELKREFDQLNEIERAG